MKKFEEFVNENINPFDREELINQLYNATTFEMEELNQMSNDELDQLAKDQLEVPVNLDEYSPNITDPKVGDILSKIEMMENDSFEGWSEDSKNGYLTATKTLKEWIKDNV